MTTDGKAEIAAFAEMSFEVLIVQRQHVRILARERLLALDWLGDQRYIVD